METRIASYQEPGLRMQLVKTFKEDIKTDGLPTSLYYEAFQIRKNRKILCTFKWERPARQKFETLIREQLLQTKLDL